MSMRGAPDRDPARPGPRWGAWLGATLAALAVVAYFQLVWRDSVEAPFLDDYDALLGFLTHWLDADGWRAHWRVTFKPHNEHVLGLPHAWVVLVHALTGRLDFRLLNLIGNGYLLLLLGALFAVSRRELPAAARLLPFAPAVLFVLQPQHWSALLSPTISLSNLGVVALAAVAFAALEREGRGVRLLAAAAALGATFSQGSGILVWLLGPVILLARGRRRAAAGWGLAAVVVLAVYLVALDPGAQRTSPFLSLGHPDRILAYALNFVGYAAGFGRPGVSLAAGAALVASFAVLVRLGLPRRGPALFALFLFVLGSIALNSLVRAHQGAGAALLQPRYAFYASVLLALTYLGWLEVLRGRPAERPWRAGALAVSAAFCVASHAVAEPDVEDLSQRLSGGLERWWTTGEGGLLHPDFRKASFFLNEGLDRGLVRLPEAWLARYGARAERRPPPPAGSPVSYHLYALHQDRRALVVSGWALAGGSALRQEVELVLATPTEAAFYPALEVLRIDLPQHPEGLAARLAPSGFHALIPLDGLAPGAYRLGIVVRRGDAESVAWRKRPVVIPSRG